MNGGRMLFDASAYMLFEASGDSEIEYFDGTIGAAFEVESDAGAEDDAQSCSYRSLPDNARVNEIDADGDGDDLGVGECFSGEEDHLEENCCDSDEEDGVVDQSCGGYMVAPPDGSKKSNACEDSKVKVMMNESERDRLFWENCLAS